MCHQAMVGIMTLPPQPFHFCGTSPRIVSDCSREAPRSAVEEANPVLVVIHQGVAGFAHYGLPVLCCRQIHGGEKARAPYFPGGILVQKWGRPAEKPTPKGLTENSFAGDSPKSGQAPTKI